MILAKEAPQSFFSTTRKYIYCLIIENLVSSKNELHSLKQMNYQWCFMDSNGKFTLVSSTLKTLKVQNFGRIAVNTSYARMMDFGDELWKNLGAADLQIKVTVSGQVFQCNSGGKWTRYQGHRVIDSGRFVQGSFAKIEFTRKI
jgi:hypothetical protein